MSPRTPKQFEEIREEKKSLIMDVALEHFANEGYFRTTINHIARDAGISKGLMYNYFESKESLLDAILQRSLTESYSYFDIDKDGYLSEDEFEYFVKKISLIIREKQSSWRLIFRLLFQNEVREQFLKSFLGSNTLDKILEEKPEGLFFSAKIKTINDYFIRKKEKKGPGYDPSLDLKMFLITLKGFVMTYIYIETADDNSFDKIVNRIIEDFK